MGKTFCIIFTFCLVGYLLIPRNVDVATVAAVLKDGTARAEGRWVVAVAGYTFNVDIGAIQQAQAATQETSVVQGFSDESRTPWAVDLLSRLGNKQPSPEIVAFVVEWSLAEDACLTNCGYSSAFERHNPLNTTQVGFNEIATIDGDGVKNYPSYEDGMAATLQTLSYSSYTEIVAGLLSNNPDRALNGLINSPWAGSRYNGGVGWPKVTVPSTDDTDTPSTNPLGQAATVVTQGYGVGSHAPAEIWGAVDLAVDRNGDGQADPDATLGTPVYATHDGIVHLAANTWPAGNHIWLEGSRFKTGYSHLNGFAVQDGQAVKRGDVIGYVGSTGQSSGPHLDYQIWQDGMNTNPLTFYHYN